MPTNTKIRRLLTRSFQRAGMNFAGDVIVNCPDLAAAYRGARYESWSLSRARERQRVANDRLQLGVRARPFAASTLEYSRSLRAALVSMSEDGCKVASALLNAEQYRHCHARVLFGNHFAWRDKAGLVSYTPAGREVVYTGNGTWARDGRQETTPARWARRILSPGALSRLTDPDFSRFAQRFAVAEAFGGYESHLRSEAGDIDRVYRDLTECGSCMIGKPVGRWYALAGAWLWEVTRSGNPVGRAILWPWSQVHNLDLPEGTAEPAYLVDRMYGDAAALEYMQQYVKRHGWVSKSRQSNSDCNFVTAEGVTVSGARAYVSAAGDVLGASYNPYLDTFPNLDEDGDLWCHASEPEQWFAEYRCTNGSYENKSREGQVQLHNGTWVDRDDACEIDGEWYSTENCCFISRHGEWMHDDDAVYCEGSGEYERREDCYEVTIGRNTYFVHEDDVCRA